MSHVWGYTIINDVTARERQRDHKQFYIGKSADTFCPMVCTKSQESESAYAYFERVQSLSQRHG
jgi:2-keto-4-pentenoate hydratase/2-oxohepta-3-ene-1,7-dioic acid hydratase in catechol pathway